MKIKEFVGGTLIGGGMMIGAFLLIKHLRLTHRLIPHGGDGLLFFISLLLSLYLALTVHELGHLAAARIMGFKFYLFVSGPFGFRRKENDRIGFFFNKNFALAGGIVSAVPSSESPDNYIKYAVLLAAGPLMSLCWSLLCFSFFIMNLHVLDYFWAYSSFMSIGILLATTIPGTSGGMYTDRARFFRLIRAGQEREIEKALLSSIALLQKTESYALLDIEKLKLIQCDKNPLISALGFRYAYYYFKEKNDTGNMQLQKQQHDIIAAHLPAYLRQPIEE